MHHAFALGDTDSTLSPVWSPNGRYVTVGEGWPVKIFVLSRRWMVERTFVWLLFNRRLSRDYERLCTTSET